MVIVKTPLVRAIHLRGGLRTPPPVSEPVTFPIPPFSPYAPYGARKKASAPSLVERAGTDSLLAPQSSGGIATPAKGRRCKVSGARRSGARRRSSVPSQQDSPSRMLLCSDTLCRLAAGTVRQVYLSSIFQAWHPTLQTEWNGARCGLGRVR
jgi:hypothetical protein